MKVKLSESHDSKLRFVCVAVFAFWMDVKRFDFKERELNIGIQAPIDSSKKPIIWVLGGPGSGKGTQCEKIVAKYGFVHMSTGDLLREEVKNGSERAKALSEIIKQGRLVPNDIVLQLLKEAMLSNPTSTKGFLVDGYPREKSQGIAFEEYVGPVSAILYFEATEETLKKRLLGRAANSDRCDDNATSIVLRLKTFIEHNDQVLEQYLNRITRISAEASVDDIFLEVQKILDPIVEAAAAAVAAAEAEAAN